MISFSFIYYNSTYIKLFNLFWLISFYNFCIELKVSYLTSKIYEFKVVDSFLKSPWSSLTFSISSCILRTSLLYNFLRFSFYSRRESFISTLFLFKEVLFAFKSFISSKTSSYLSNSSSALAILYSSGSTLLFSNSLFLLF